MFHIFMGYMHGLHHRDMAPAPTIFLVSYDTSDS